MANEATATVAEPLRGRSAADRRTFWLLCRAGTHLCALPLAHVIETMRLLPIESISGMPRYVRGLCIIRGAPVPVIDAGLLIGDRPTTSGRLVTIRTGGRTIALAADMVLGVWSIGAEMLEGLPPLLRDAAGETIAGIGTLDAELLFFLRTTLRVPDELFDRLAPDGASA